MKRIPDCWTVCTERKSAGFWRAMCLNNGCLIGEAFGDTEQEAEANLVQRMQKKIV